MALPVFTNTPVCRIPSRNQKRFMCVKKQN